MPSRLRFLPLILVATVGLFAITTVITAQPPAAPTAPGPDGIKRTEEENLKMYKRFADELLKLAQKWEKSDNPEEKERAKTLRAALKIAEEKGVEKMFKELLNPSAGEIGSLIAKDKALITALREILEILSTEDEAKRLQKDIKDLEKYLAEAKRILRDQETQRARTENGKGLDRIAKDQNQLAKDTKDLANQLKPKGKDGDPKNGKNGDPKDDKSEPKPDSSKPGDPNAEPKSDTKDPKSTDKAPMGDPKSGEPKPGDPKNGMPMAGLTKEPPKDSPMDPKSGKGMGEPMMPMPMNPMEPKPSDSKAQGMGKGDSKPSQPKGGDSKPMSPSDSPPSQSPPSGSKGSPSDSPSSPPSKRPPNPSNPNDDAQKNLDEAVPDQKEAEKKLNDKKPDDAGKNQDDAIEKIAKAIKELEKRLKQLREKEMRQKLEDLERRVAKMLQMQTEVYEATKRIDSNIKKNKEIATSDRQRSTVEAEKEGAIAEEAQKALRLLEGEGTAVVFAGVLDEARKDMEAVKKELDRTNVAADTQLVEEQIIAQLKRMLEALKKAKQDLDNPPPPPPPGSPPPSDPKKNLIQLVEQLKLLKELQIQVNQRTEAFGKRTPGAQAADPFIQEQLKQLGERQETLKKMLHKVADQMNQ
jgi:hypothetical protein